MLLLLLTCCVTQAMLGVPFFYGFGLAMYARVGPFHALFFAIGVFTLQCACAHWWLKRFSYGPLEWVWRAATLRSLRVPMRRQPARRGIAAGSRCATADPLPP